MAKAYRPRLDYGNCKIVTTSYYLNGFFGYAQVTTFALVRMVRLFGEGLQCFVYVDNACGITAVVSSDNIVDIILGSGGVLLDGEKADEAAIMARMVLTDMETPHG
jgi:hypothetical protein